MTQFLDENFWLAVSFCIFVYLIYRPVKQSILAILDEKITVIKEEVLEAARIKSETELLYQQTLDRIQHLSQVQERMFQEEKSNIDKIIAEKNKEFELLLAHKRDKMTDHLKSQNIMAMQNVQAAFSDEVIKLVTKYFQSASAPSPDEDRIIASIRVKNRK